MTTQTDPATSARRKLILRDSLGFLGLLAITLALFAVTLFLFRSFTVHRQALAVRWSDRGRVALQSGKPAQAIVALRTALSYAPDTRAYELLLAQALGEAGHAEESYNYFMELWAVEPGSGFTNLQLAHLAAAKGDRSAAINFYRAAIYGTWEGDGVVRRSQIRLELARYLIATREFAPARMELLIAAGNVPETAAFDATLASLLLQAEDPIDARAFYQKTLVLRPGDPAALRAAAHLAYAAADYPTAIALLERLHREANPADSADHAPDPAATQQKAEDDRILEDSTQILKAQQKSRQPARTKRRR